MTYRFEAGRIYRMPTVLAILRTIAGRDTPAEVRGSCWAALDDLQAWMQAQPAAPGWKATYALVTHTIATFQQDPAKFAPPAVALPPFDPLVAADGPQDENTAPGVGE